MISLADLCYLRDTPAAERFAHVHPQWWPAHAAAKDTAARFGVLRDARAFDASQFVLHVALCYGDERVPLSLLTLLTEWHLWLWTLDDRLDSGDLHENAARRTQVLCTLHARCDALCPDFALCTQADVYVPDVLIVSAHEARLYALGAILEPAQDTHTTDTHVDADACDPHVGLLEHILTRVAARDAPAHCLHRFLRGIEQYLRVNACAQRTRSSCYKAYVRERLLDSAVEPCLALGELHALECSGADRLAYNTQTATRLDALSRVCNALLSLSNDLFSYEKERHSEYNWLLAIQREHRLSTLGDAVAHAKRALACYWRVFCALEHALGAESAALRCYVQLARTWITGTTLWSLYISLRYKSATSPFTELRLASKL